MSKAVSYTVQEGIAVVTLDAPEGSVNILNADFLQELAETANRLSAEKGVQGTVVTSAKPGGFIAGADIRQIEGVDYPEQGANLARQGQRIFGLWAALPFPVVAAVHGHCMGGGTEFILACHYRVAAEDAAIALPEVKLGILPGFGGTQRLPRLVSIEKALNIILSGRTVRAAEALKIGLADRSVPQDALCDAAVALAREAAQAPGRLLAERQRKKRGMRTFFLEKTPPGRALLFSQVRQTVLRQTGGHYPAPLQALEVVRRGQTLSLEEGLKLEAEALGRLVTTPECKNLIHVFFLSQRPKKGAGVTVEAQPVQRAAVLGAGVMGGGIAQLLASRGIPVLLKDIRQDAVDAGMEHARELFRLTLAKRGQDEAAVSKKMELLTGTTGYDGFSEVDLVIEAVVEKMGVKQAVLQESEGLLGAGAVFATNTSALSVSELQSVAERPGNVGGLHFFNPVERMPLVEIIRGEGTADRTVATLFEVARRLGKTPIVVADRPGFLVNRLLGAYLNEACLLAAAGAGWQSLDRLAKGFGMPMGPFRLIDEVGIDIAAEVGKTLCGAFPYLTESPLLEMAVSNGLKGKKGGRGFYLYPPGKKPAPNRDIGQQLGLRTVRSATTSDWRRLLLLMVNEAGRCLEEGLVTSPEDVDTGMVFGTGFPPFYGGLCRWADAEGLPALVAELEELAKEQGERFAPCDYLRGRKGFYP